MRRLSINSSADQLFSKEGHSNQLRWAGSKVSHWIILCIPVQYFGERGWVQQRPFPIRDTHAAFPTRSILVNKESDSVAVLQTEDLFFSFSRDLWSNLYIPVQYFGERGWVEQRPFPIGETHAAFATRSILVNKESARAAGQRLSSSFLGNRGAWAYSFCFFHAPQCPIYVKVFTANSKFYHSWQFRKPLNVEWLAEIAICSSVPTKYMNPLLTPLWSLGTYRRKGKGWRGKKKGRGKREKRATFVPASGEASRSMCCVCIGPRYLDDKSITV